MRLELAGPEQNPDALAAQFVHALLEGRASGESRVDEGQHNDGDAEARGFGEDAESVGVADPVGPLVDRVVGRGCDDDCIGLRGPEFAGAAVFTAHRPAALGFELGRVDERQRRWRRDDLDVPAAVMSQFHQSSDLSCGSCSAHDHIENPALGWLSHLVAPMRAANSLRWGRTVGGAVASRSLTRRRTAGGSALPAVRVPRQRAGPGRPSRVCPTGRTPARCPRRTMPCARSRSADRGLSRERS